MIQDYKLIIEIGLTWGMALVTLVVWKSYLYQPRFYRNSSFQRDDAKMEVMAAREESRKAIDMVKKLAQEMTQTSVVEKEITDDYVILDLPDSMKHAFIDYLQGFEEFARIKGYSVLLSQISTISGKFAFKFSLQEDSSRVSEQQIKDHIQEYVDIVRQGGDFSHLRATVSQKDYKYLDALQGRMGLLRENYGFKEVGTLDPEHFANALMIKNVPHTEIHSHIHVGDQSQKSLSAPHSKNVTFGDHNMIDNTDYSSIVITNLPDKRNEQIEKLDELIQSLSREQKVTDDVRQSLITNFDKVKEELRDEECPDKAKIYKWLYNTKKILETVVLSHHITEAAKWIYHTLNFIPQK